MPKMIDGMTSEEIGAEQTYLCKKRIAEIMEHFRVWSLENTHLKRYAIDRGDMDLLVQMLFTKGYGEVTDKERLEFLEARLKSILRKVEQEHHWAHKRDDYDAADTLSEIYGRLKETIEQAFGNKK